MPTGGDYSAWHHCPVTSPPARTPLGTRYWRLWTASVISNLGDGVAQVAYPWLASAVTRNALLLAGIAVAQRLPWLLFTLPAGVITDRLDRRRIIVSMNLVAAALTVLVAVAVLAGQSSLPTGDEVSAGVFTLGPGIYLVLLYVSAVLFGMAEVLRDNSSQTILPAIVEPAALERANGSLWGAEMVANSFVGPPLGGFLLALAFSVPFFVDAGSFAIAAGLVFFIAGNFRAEGSGSRSRGKISWRREIADGVRWLWRHPLLRPMAIILGIMNGVTMMAFATFVLFAQEILDVDATTFGILGTGAALGGVLGSVFAAKVSRALGSGTSLYLTIVGSAVLLVVQGATSSWPVFWLAMLGGVFLGTVWNVITVSLRQTIIPDELLGRVNSVYRFFGWGMMPLGAIVGGIVVAAFEVATSRELALRMVFFIAAGIYGLAFIYAVPRLTTAKIESARAEGLEGREAVSPGTGVIQEAVAETGVIDMVPSADTDD